MAFGFGFSFFPIGFSKVPGKRDSRADESFRVRHLSSQQVCLNLNHCTLYKGLRDDGVGERLHFMRLCIGKRGFVLLTAGQARLSADTSPRLARGRIQMEGHDLAETQISYE